MFRSLMTLAIFLLPLPLAAQFDRDGGGEDVWKSLSARYDTNQDGRIDAEEYTRGAEKFERLDRNDDGSLTEADFDRRRGRRGAPDFSRVAAGRFVGAADADKDGDVTKAEWKAFLASLGAGEDGVIDREKLQSVFPGRGRVDPADRGDRPEPGDRAGGGFGARMVRLLDRDGDEQVEIADLEVVFSEVDRDGSGVIEAGERRARQGGRRPGGGRDRGREDADSTVPQPGDPAPDFELPYAKDGKKTVRLAGFAGRRPVALVFGSYT